MPTYSYRCKSCGHTFEAFHSMSAEPLKDCPKETCHGLVEKLIGTGAGMIFKGGGFYETDYKTKTGKPESACSSCDKAGSCSE